MALIEDRQSRIACKMKLMWVRCAAEGLDGFFGMGVELDLLNS